MEEDLHSDFPQQDYQVESANMIMNDLLKQNATQNEEDSPQEEDETIGEDVRRIMHEVFLKSFNGDKESP